MSAPREDEPFSESNLDSPAYRDRLMRKLNCLIAVLEVACAKVRRSLAGPDPDVDRLMRIHKNLRETLEVCQRARRALEQREDLPQGLPENLARVVGRPALGPGSQRATAVPAIEFETEDQRRRFAAFAPIAADELRGVDLDELIRKLVD